MLKQSLIIIKKLSQLSLGILIFVFGYAVIGMGLDEYDSEKKFRLYGVPTTAKLNGYHYSQGTRYSPSGDSPVYLYTSKDGSVHTHTATEYGVASPSNKKELAIEKVTITYLSSDPDMARVDKWHNHFSYIWHVFLGVFLCLSAPTYLCAEHILSKRKQNYLAQTKGTVRQTLSKTE